MKRSHLNAFVKIAILATAVSGCSKFRNTTITSMQAQPQILASGPCQDFYEYACGNWIKSHEIPADLPKWDSFTAVQENNYLIEQDVLKQISDKNYKTDDSDIKKLGDFYASCTDEASIEFHSIDALKKTLAEVDSISNLKELSKEIAKLHLEGVNVLFGFEPDQDFKDATQMIAVLSQGGLSLTYPKYYLNDKDSNIKKIRAAFVKTIANMLVLLGVSESDASSSAQTVLMIETELAKISLEKEDLRDPQKIYHPLDFGTFVQNQKNFLWSDYFSDLRVAPRGKLNNAIPQFISGMDELLGKSKLEDIKQYIRWRVISDSADMMGRKFRDEKFKMAQMITGAKAQRERWKECLAASTDAFPDVVGKVFVDKAFSKESKATIQEMIEGVRKAFARDFADLTWMDSATRQKANEKLAKIGRKIGFPDSWKTYSEVQIARDRYFENTISASVSAARRTLGKIGKPVNRTEMNMPAPTVNAYYNPSLNEIVFPAGILQPPFYDPKASAATNFGSIIWVMGHEMTHAFDDQGSQFDGDGNLNNWWSPNVGDDFKKKGECIVKQYSSYNPIDDLHINGERSEGENIADLGGAKLSYSAMKFVRQGQPGSGIEDDREFFLGMAKIWCANMRPEYLRYLVLNNEHSPAKYRVNGVLSNMPEFAEAFSCRAGDPMAPKNRCEVW